MKKVILIMTMTTMFLAGGLVFAEVSADTPEEPEVVTEEVTEEVTPEEPEVEPEEIAEDAPEATPEAEPEIVEPEEATPETPEEIIEAQTGLHADYFKHIEGNGTWDAYYLEADGDIYAVTIKRGNVDVVAQLN